MKRLMILIFLIFFLSTQTVCALEIHNELYHEFGVDSVLAAAPNDVREILSEFDFRSINGIDDILARILGRITDSLKEQLKIIWTPAMNTIYVITFCSIVSVLFPDKKHAYVIMIVGSLSIIFFNLDDTSSFFSDSVQVIRTLYDFSSVLLPCLACASVFTGATISAGLKYTAASLFMNVLLNICNTVLIPIVSIYLVCLIGGCVFEQELLCKISELIYWGCKTVLRGAVVLFVTYLTLSGMITGAGEVFAVKIAKTTISNGLPIVGKLVSDTASTLVAGATLLRNGIGVYGMLTIICILIIPITSVGVRYFLFKIVSKIAALYPEKRFVNLINGISEVYGMIFAIIGTGFVMLFLTLISFMQVTGVL